MAITLGVPFGTLLAGMVSWRAAFVFVAIWALCSLLLIWRLVPQIEAVADAGLAGQFRFLGKPGPWIVLGAVFLGNTGIFCWWSYVSPWLETVGGWSAATLPGLRVLGGPFFPSRAQQRAMGEAGQGGGEMIGSACVQVAFNGGNAVGAQIGQAVLNSGAAYNVPALAGAPITAGAVALLALYALRFESQYHKKAVTPRA